MSKPIFLEWTVNAVNQVEQRIYRTIDDLPETPLAVVGPTVTSYEDTEATTLATTSVTYRVESVGVYRGEETRASSLTTTVTIENEPLDLIADPYTFKVATNSLAMSSTQPFYVKVGDTKVSAVGSEAAYSLSHEVSDLEQPIRVYSENTPSGYDASITVTSPISEIVSWSEFDWGVNGVGVKPNLAQLIKVPETAPITTSYHTLFSGAVNFNDPSVSLWATVGVTNMVGVFQNCQKFNQPLSNWSTAAVTTMRSMFDRCSTFNQPVDHFDVTLVQDLGWMFNACQVFNQPLTSWNTASAKDMGGMFRVAAKFDQPIGHFVTTNVTTFADMFSGASIFNQDISGWDTANVTTMNGMFYNAEKFHQDISGWNVAKVADMKEMFYGARAFNYSLTEWCVSLISSIPVGFATGAINFTNGEHPVWGTCPSTEPTVTAPDVSMAILMVNGADESSQLNLYCNDLLVNTYAVGVDFENASGLVQRDILDHATVGLVGVKQLNGFMIRNLDATNQYNLRFELIGTGMMALMDGTMQPIVGDTVTPTDVRIHTVGEHTEMDGLIMVGDGTTLTYEPRTVNLAIGFGTSNEFTFSKEYAESFTTHDLFRDMVSAMNSNFGAQTVGLTTDAEMQDVYFDLIKDDPAFDGLVMVFAGSDHNQTAIRFAQNEGGAFKYFYLRKPDSKLGQPYDDLDVLFPNTSMSGVITGTF